MSKPLKAPFPYFGGKSRVARLVWEKLGQVDNFIEPFAGTLAVLLKRPQVKGVETVNDLDGLLANFWRAVRLDPERTAEHADWPVSEIDLHARHRWLKGNRKRITDALRADPEWFDAKAAGWWCWGLCCWIGGGWCVNPEWEGRFAFTTTSGVNATATRPRLSSTIGNGGVNSTIATGKRPRIGARKRGFTGVGVGYVDREACERTARPQLADAFDIGRGVNSSGDLGTCDERRAWLVDWFHALADRLRLVRVCCGDWRRVCDSESVLTRLGVTGLFLDPPYSAEAGRNNNLYAQESTTVAHEVREWCLKWGGESSMRIILAGYAGEGHEALEDHGWKVHQWETTGGYANLSGGKGANAKKERLWLSPHCDHGISLFD